MYGYKVLVSGILTAEREIANNALIWTFVTGRAVPAVVMVKVLSVRSCVRTQFWHRNDMSETVAVICVECSLVSEDASFTATYIRQPKL